MIKVGVRGTKLLTFPQEIYWETTENYDYFKIEVEHQGQRYTLVNQIPYHIRNYIWYPEQPGDYKVYVIGIKKKASLKFLIVSSNVIQFFVGDKVDSTQKILTGDFYEFYREKGLSCGSWYDIDKALLGQSCSVRSYKINDKEIINLPGENVYKDFIKETQSKNILYSLPPVVKDQPTTITLVTTSGIELLSYVIPRSYCSSFWPEKVKRICYPYICRDVNPGKERNTFIASFHTNDHFFITETDKNGIYETSSIFRPGFISTGIGRKIKLIEKEEDFDINNTSFSGIHYFYKGSWNLVEGVLEGLCFNPYDYSFSTTIGQEDVVVDFIIDKPVEGDNLFGYTGNVTVYVKNKYTLSPISGVSITLSKGEELSFSQDTDISGITYFSSIPYGNYTVGPSVIQFYTFEPAFKEIEVSETRKEVHVTFYGVPYSTLTGKLKSQYNNPLIQPIQVIIENPFTGFKKVVFENSEYTVDVTDRGVYRIYCDHLSSPTQHFIKLDSLGGVISGLDFTIPVSRIQGRVFEIENQHGIEDVEVEIYNGFLEEPRLNITEDGIELTGQDSPFYTQFTDYSGIYYIDVFPGRYTLRAKKVEYNLNDIITWLMRTLHLPGDSPLILLLKEYENATPEEKKQLIDSIKQAAQEQSQEGQALLECLQSAGAATRYYFQPTQRLVEVDKGLITGQDFFRENTYFISGRFIDGYTGNPANNEEGSGIDFWVLTSNPRMLYPQARYKINDVVFTDRGLGKTLEGRSTGEGTFYLTNLLPGDYTIVPLKRVEKWTKKIEEDGTVYYSWEPVNSDPYNFGYVFRPPYKEEWVVGSNKENVTFLCYKGVVSGIVVNPYTSQPIPEVKVELVGGEYKVTGDDKPQPLAKQTFTNEQGVFIFDFVKPLEHYQLHLFTISRDNKYRHYIPNDVTKTTSIEDPNILFLDGYLGIISGIEYERFYLSGTVLDVENKPISTIVSATGKEMEPVDIVNGWEKGSIISRYTFEQETDENGFYKIEIPFPDSSYIVYPASYGYKYTPEAYKIDVIDSDIGSLDFIGEEAYSGLDQYGNVYDRDRYWVQGSVREAWSGSGIEKVTMIAVNKLDNKSTFKCETDCSGIFCFDEMPRGFYYIYPDLNTCKDSIFYPYIPYYVNTYYNNVSGIDFDVVFLRKVKGCVKYEDGTPLPYIPILINQAHSKVEVIDFSGCVLWSYDENLYLPTAVETSTGYKIIANEGKHNVILISGNQILESYGELTLGNSLPGPISDLHFPCDVDDNLRGHIKTVSFGNNTVFEIVSHSLIKNFQKETNSFTHDKEDPYRVFDACNYTTVFDKFNQTKDSLVQLRTYKEVLGRAQEELFKLSLNPALSPVDFDLINEINFISGISEETFKIKPLNIVMKNMQRIVIDDQNNITL